MKHVSLADVKTISIRDLRQRWPEAEKALLTENEIIVTRDSKPIAKLVRYVAERKVRKRFDPEAHGKWQERTHGNTATRWVDKYLGADRDGRTSSGK